MTALAWEGGGGRVCEKGYIYNITDLSCVDVDECVVNAHDCEEESTRCVNIEGSFRCDCKDNQHVKISLNKCGPVTHSRGRAGGASPCPGMWFG